jgi:hypothetical protein
MLQPTDRRETTFLMISFSKDDGAQLIGRLPSDIPLRELRELAVTESPTKAIRAKCVDCSGHNMAEVRKCVAIDCALWPFRMGHSPFRGKQDDDARSALQGAVP